jgi:hypothetical protein
VTTWGAVETPLPTEPCRLTRRRSIRVHWWHPTMRGPSERPQAAALHR